jgi:ADP-ribose pyrophosphatase YjhB (NUDIX family)
MHELIKEIRAIAQTGLHYTRDVYDRERYQRLAEIAHALYAMSSDADIDTIERFFFPEKGYATPKVDLRACVIREEEVLLVRERSDGRWTLPGGWADQNESPIEGVVREVKEESGFDVVVTSLYAVRDRDRGSYVPRYPVSLYKLFFTATVVGGSPSENTEISEVAFFDVRDLPPLSTERVLAEDIRKGYEHFRRNASEVHCD